MLGFLVVKGEIVDKRLEQIARPSRLFNLGFIQSDFAPRSEWEVHLSPDHDRFFYVAAQQAFLWLRKGACSYIFASADGRYVLKFIHIGNMKGQQPHGFFNKLFAIKKKHSKRLGQFEDLFLSSRICFDELREETGVIYAHLNRTRDKIHGLKLIDSYGQSQRVVGDETCFVVQQKAQPLIPTLTVLMDKGEVSSAKLRVDQVLDLLVSLARKGYVDGNDDLILNNNIGFIEKRAIYLDNWHFFRAKNLDVVERMRYEVHVRLKPLETWLEMTYPSLCEYYRQKTVDLLGRLIAEKKEVSIIQGPG